MVLGHQQEQCWLPGLTYKSGLFPLSFSVCYDLCGPNDIIQNGRWDHMKSGGTSCLKLWNKSTWIQHPLTKLMKTSPSAPSISTTPTAHLLSGTSFNVGFLWTLLILTPWAKHTLIDLIELITTTHIDCLSKKVQPRKTQVSRSVHCRRELFNWSQ